MVYNAVCAWADVFCIVVRYVCQDIFKYDSPREVAARDLLYVLCHVAHDRMRACLGSGLAVSVEASMKPSS